MKHSQTEEEKEKNAALAFALARSVIGLNLMMHGLVRIPKWTGFAEKMQELYKDTVLPSSMVYAFGLTLTPVEALLGLMLLVGIWTRWALVFSMGLMAVLIFGSTLLENWTAVAQQMVYTTLLYFLLRDLKPTSLSIDSLMAKRSAIDR